MGVDPVDFVLIEALSLEYHALHCVFFGFTTERECCECTQCSHATPPYLFVKVNRIQIHELSSIKGESSAFESVEPSGIEG